MAERPADPGRGDGADATRDSGFRRHRHLGYQGHALPWPVILLWAGWLAFAVTYFVRWVLPA